MKSEAMDLKQHPNHKKYIEILRQMPPEKRLAKAFELSNISKKLFTHGLHERFPGLSGKKFQKNSEEFKKIIQEYHME